MRRSTGAANIYLGSCYNSGNIWRTSHLYPELCLIYIWGNCIIILCSLTTSAAAFDIICKNMKKINTYCQCYHSSMSTTYHNPQKDIFLMFLYFLYFQPKLPDCRSKVRRLLSGLWDVQRMQVYQGDSSNIIIRDQSGKDPRYMFLILISFAVTLLRGGTREWRGLPGNFKKSKCISYLVAKILVIEKIQMYFLPCCQNSLNPVVSHLWYRRWWEDSSTWLDWILGELGEILETL